MLDKIAASFKIDVICWGISVRQIFILVALLGMVGCVSRQPFTPRIIYKPIGLDKAHIKKTQRFMCQHYGYCHRDVQIKPLMIVLLLTGTETLHQAYQQNVSMQYIVSRSGKVYQTMPSNWMARHTTGLNYLAIGIGNVGEEDDADGLTSAQANADVYLIRMLKKQYPGIEYLVSHNESYCFRELPLWRELKDVRFKPRLDPGATFMSKIRGQVTHLDLRGCGD
ncbi:MAG: hypothetical protein COB66_06590 [Coxiella sp. (in: Bacteria)]|nr:MAG: hypothetical protein COB66_06590 [Coxiella sp. (in: g-proteobacteria)]